MKRTSVNFSSAELIEMKWTRVNYHYAENFACIQLLSALLGVNFGCFRLGCVEIFPGKELPHDQDFSSFLYVPNVQRDVHLSQLRCLFQAISCKAWQWRNRNCCCSAIWRASASRSTWSPSYLWTYSTPFLSTPSSSPKRELDDLSSLRYNDDPVI